MYSFLSATTFFTSRCARLNTRKPNDATVQTPPGRQITIRYISTQVIALTHHTDKSNQELVQTCRPLTNSEGHAFQVEFEEDPWDSFAMLKRPRIICHGVLHISYVANRTLTWDVISLRRLASIYVVGTTRRKYWNIVNATSLAVNPSGNVRLGVDSILISRGCDMAGK